MLHDPFGRSRLPSGFTREDRVRLLAEAAAALLRGELPSAEARLFVGAAVDAWLRHGGRCGSLEKHYLKVTQKERSRLTSQRLYERCARTATGDDDDGTLEPGNFNQESEDETGNP